MQQLPGVWFIPWMYNKPLPETQWEDSQFTAPSDFTTYWKNLHILLYPLLFTATISNNQEFVISTSAYLKICLPCFRLFVVNKSDFKSFVFKWIWNVRDCFHAFKQSISFCLTDIQVLISIKTNPKLCFQNFPKVQGTNCIVRQDLYIKCLYTSTNNRFLYKKLYNITCT